MSYLDTCLLGVSTRWQYWDRTRLYCTPGTIRQGTGHCSGTCIMGRRARSQRLISPRSVTILFYWYHKNMLPLISPRSVTINITKVCYNWYQQGLLQLISITSVTIDFTNVCYNWYHRGLLQLIHVSSRSVTIDITKVCYNWFHQHLLQLI